MTRLLMAMTADRVDDVCDSATLDLINQRFETTWAADHHDRLDSDAVRELLPGHEIVLTSWGTPALPSDLLGAPNNGPSVVGHAAGSVKNLLQPTAVRSGVTVFSAASRIAWSVGEYCLSALLTLLRRLPEYDAGVRRGDWKPTTFRGSELRGARIGIVGASSTARAFIELLRPFGPEIVVHDPYLSAERAASLGVSVVGLDEVMTSPVLSVHVPATPETEDLITADLIDRLPAGAIVINSSRAAAIDTDALIAAAAAGRLRVALDVFRNEPPDLDASIRGNANLLLTPHIAGDTTEGHRSLTRYVLDDVITFQQTGRRGPSWVDPATLSIIA